MPRTVTTAILKKVMQNTSVCDIFCFPCSSPPPPPTNLESAVEHRASRYRSRRHPSTAKRQGAAATSDWPAERYTVVRARARHAYTTYGCTPAAALLGEHRALCDGAVWACLEGLPGNRLFRSDENVTSKWRGGGRRQEYIRTI